MPRDPARRPATWMLPPAPYALGLYAGWRLEHDLSGLPFDLGIASTVLGGALIAVGLTLFFWTLFTFWRHKTTVNPYLAASTLCVDGPFRLTRNPIYLGDWWIYAGVMLLMRTLWPIVFIPLIWAIIRYAVIRHEEAHLEARFADDYRNYKARVNRWL